MAESEGFDLLITTDKNLRYQQNLRGRRLAILVLWTTSWPQIRTHSELIRNWSRRRPLFSGPVTFENSRALHRSRSARGDRFAKLRSNDR